MWCRSGFGADFVERAAQEQRVGGDARQLERARRHQEHFVGGARQVVVAVSAVLEVRVNRLAGLLEIEDRVAQFLNLAPERGGEPGRLQQHGADARVDFGLAQVVDERTNGRCACAAAHIADDVGRRDLGEIAAHPQRQRGIRRDGRLAAEEQIEGEQAGHRDDQRHSKQREDDGESAAGHMLSLVKA